MAVVWDQRGETSPLKIANDERLHIELFDLMGNPVATGLDAVAVGREPFYAIGDGMSAEQLAEVIRPR